MQVCRSAGASTLELTVIRYLIIEQVKKLEASSSFNVYWCWSSTHYCSLYVISQYHHFIVDLAYRNSRPLFLLFYHTQFPNIAHVVIFFLSGSWLERFTPSHCRERVDVVCRNSVLYCFRRLGIIQRSLHSIHAGALFLAQLWPWVASNSCQLGSTPKSARFRSLFFTRLYRLRPTSWDFIEILFSSLEVHDGSVLAQKINPKTETNYSEGKGWGDQIHLQHFGQ